MIIDITIKDNNGTPIHHIVKNLEDGKDIIPLTIEQPGLKPEFKDFLAMYLSDSGRTVRERLLPCKLYFKTIISGQKINFNIKQEPLTSEKQYNVMNQAVNKYELSFRTLDYEEEEELF
ncbi:MAG: hypothetical protein K0S61_3477 [Anaerocolumna sp.]|jgi:hypothetical protein|nr:hypothetical protein [Anaerocolumna sp.]